MQSQPFSHAQATEIKKALIKGVHPTALARVYRCSTETIRRMKRGETYNHVVVEGEDSMRPPIDYVAEAPVPTNHLTMPTAVPKMTAEAEAASVEKVYASLRAAGITPE